MCGNNGVNFIATLHNVILAPYRCDRLFSIILLTNSGHTCLFHKGFCTVYFGNKEKNVVTLSHSAERKHAFWEEINQMSKSKKIAPRKKVALELLHYILGHISPRSLLAGATDFFGKDIELTIYPDPFCTSCQIPSTNKNPRSKNTLKPKSPFKWVFMDIIPATAPKSMKNETTFSNYILIVDAYYKIPKLHNMNKITT